MSFEETGRTFGAIKRFQGALLPIMYKLGVMSAVIFMTLFLAFKSVFITTLILVLNLTFFAIKFGSYLKQDHGHHYVGGWSPPPLPIQHGHGWGPQKDVHLHIHNAHGKPDFSIPYSTLSGGWDSQPHSSAVEPTWSTANNYIHSGRGFAGNDLMPYTNIANINDDTFNAIKSKIIAKRSDEREPTIVMAQSSHEVKPFNSINKQKRK